MPEPRISIQPVCLHVGQPVPPQIWHCTSISAEGSVKGKNDGRNRTRVSALKKRRAKVASVALKSTKLIPSSTARPSICSNTGECDASNGSRRVALQRADLHRRGVGPQQEIAAEEEGVLGVEGRMVLGEIQGVEVVALGLDVRPHRAGEAELVEDLADLVHHLRDEVQPARPAGAPGHGEIDTGRGPGGGVFQVALPRGERRLEILLQGVGLAADLLLGGGLELGQRREDLGERAGLAPEDLGLEIREPALVRLRDLLQTLPQLGEGCQEVAHGQRACFATSANCWNAAGSRTARSASTLRLISTPARRSPFMRRLYESWCSRAAALMRMIQRRRKSPFLRRRSR